MGQKGQESHHIQKEWPKRETFTFGQKNIVHPPLVNSGVILLPPLHIKLRLFKNFVKEMDKNSAGFHYLKEKFPHVSDAKIKEGIFVGPQITALTRDEKFEDMLSQVDKSAWRSFKNVVQNFFLGNFKNLQLP
jgi:hypothetical protein